MTQCNVAYPCPTADQMAAMQDVQSRVLTPQNCQSMCIIPVPTALPSYKGCYKDNKDGVRVLPNNVGTNMSWSACYNAVKKADPTAKFLGMQDLNGSVGSCWYGNADPASQGSGSGCVTRDGYKIGPTNVNAVYRI
jgi:hypothetical protein